MLWHQVPKVRQPDDAGVIPTAITLLGVVATGTTLVEKRACETFTGVQMSGEL
jgi:hypothetical protein